jgi:hypothetical protein
MKAALIAPCGMNCNVCRAVLDKSGRAKQCPGCKPRGKGCTYYGGMCAKVKNEEVRFCHECDGFPCEKLRRLDKRYRTRYDYSFLEALEFIRDRGMGAHLAREKMLWKCPECGGTVCIHNRQCYDCGKGGKRKAKR